MKHTVLLRPAIAMIELIFAIVIMGIVLMSAPMLIATASKSAVIALQQEGINEASARIAMIMTYPWDQNDINDSCIPPILHVTAGNPAMDESNNSRRVGVPLKSASHTFKCGKKELNASAIAVDGLDDIDDFTNTSLVIDNTGAGGKDYIEKTTVTIETSVKYANENQTRNFNSSSITFAPLPALINSDTTNIKRIDVKLTSSSSEDELKDKEIVLHAFSCNIGGFDYESGVAP